MRFGCLAIVLVVLAQGAAAQTRESEFCSSHTTEAYHSPKCNEWVVHDPQRVEGVRIAHKPAYHTYSRWALGDQTYVVAYRDVDNQPMDMVADIYRAHDHGYKRIGMIAVSDMVTNVSAEELTFGVRPDLVFWADCGQLKCISVLRFSNGKAQEVFSYGASQIKISSAGGPRIVAESWHANVGEEFAWDPRARDFRTVREYRLRKRNRNDDAKTVIPQGLKPNTCRA